METDETIKKGFLRLERYAQNIPGGFHCCAEDPENGYPFAYVSDRFLEILGWEREEFAARFDNRYTALLHPDDLAAGLRYRNAENSATYAKNGDSIFRLLGKNGYRWVTNAANQVEWYGKGYIVGTITDITPYMELREKLEQQNRTQREALENANHNLLRMMQQMEEQKTQFAQTTARNMKKEERYRQRLNHDALTGTYNRRFYEEVVRNNIGPAGIALTTPRSTHVATGEHLALSSTGHTSLSIGKRLLASASQGMRLFVQNMGWRLVAAFMTIIGVDSFSWALSNAMARWERV